MDCLWNAEGKECEEEPASGVYIVVARCGGAIAPVIRDSTGSGSICPREQHHNGALGVKVKRQTVPTAGPTALGPGMWNNGVAPNAEHSTKPHWEVNDNDHHQHRFATVAQHASVHYYLVRGVLLLNVALITWAWGTELVGKRRGTSSSPRHTGCIMTGVSDNTALQCYEYLQKFHITRLSKPS